MMRMEEPPMMKLARAVVPMLLGMVLWLFIFWAGAALAQPTVTRGGALKKRQYQTYSAMTLYVDPTGSDSNACTSSGTGACLTVQGAVNKLPRFIRHAVTVNVAAGTYATATQVANLYFDVGGTLTIQGSSTWTPVSPATGTGSGTMTGYTAATAYPTAYGTITDSGQAWTADELKGYYVAIGTTRRVIVGNTATTLQLNATMTGAGVGAAYTIETPSTINTGAWSLLNLEGPTDVGSKITLADMTWSLSGTTTILTCRKVDFSASGQYVLLRNLRLTTSGTGTGLLLAGCRGVGTSASTVYIGSSVSIDPQSVYFDTGGYTRGSVSVVTNNGAFVTGTGNTSFPVYETTSTAATSSVFRAFSYSSQEITATSTWTKGVARCPTGAVGNAFQLGFTSSGVVFYAPTNAIVSNVRMESCASGLAISSGSTVGHSASLTVNVGGPLQFSGVTNELVLDGEAFTYASFLSLNPRNIQTGRGTTLSSE